MIFLFASKFLQYEKGFITNMKTLKAVHNMCNNICITCESFSTYFRKSVARTARRCKTHYFPQINPLFVIHLFHTVKPKILPVEHIFYPLSTPPIIKTINL